MAKIAVAPLVGAWIEIPVQPVQIGNGLSLPSWERGLKYRIFSIQFYFHESLPSWERGLKSSRISNWETGANVAPLVGAWIEISRFLTSKSLNTCRSPRGSVD